MGNPKWWWLSRLDVLCLAVAGGVVGGAIVAVVMAATAFKFPSQLDVALNLVPPTTRIASGGTAHASFGGSYSIASGQTTNKQEEFDLIRDPAKGIDWKSSATRELNRGLFEKSIKDNAASGMPEATRYQRYNYVVKRGSIRVAIWTVSGSMTDACNKLPATVKYQNLPIIKGVMINFFPEDQNVPTGKVGSPDMACFLTPYTLNPSKQLGVLDAHSKHFMLAQDIVDSTGGKRLATLRDYVTGASWATWKNEEVDYAGEILVDVIGCYYIINNGSGTYAPKNGGGNFEYLLLVAQLFKEKVEVSPSAVWGFNSLVPAIKIPESGKPLQCS